MIGELMTYCNNFFLKERYDDVYTISNGAINFELPRNCFFYIDNSLYNDGVHKNDASLELVDEEFNGAVLILAPPKAFLDLAQKIEKYNEKHQPNGYNSESFGGYSYSKSAADADSWQNVFKTDLRRWRKI